MKRSLLVCLTLGSSAAYAQQSIKPRPLGAPVAVSKEVLGSATLARQLPNGGVLVNDATRRRLLLLDSTLQSYTVVADSTAGSVNGYGQRPGALLPYAADSTLYLDVTAGSFLVIDPAGKVVRVMSTPRPNDNSFLAVTQYGFPGFDAKGRLVYRTRFQPQLMQTRDGGIQMGQQPDSSPIIRVDLDTRRADTIGAVKVAKNISSEVAGPNGGIMRMQSPVPLPMVDDWALLSDGSVAFIRGQDYHIDWIKPDGSRATTGKVAYDWRRLTDDDKLVIIDSIAKARAAIQAMGPGQPGQMMIGGGRGDISFRMDAGGGGDRMAATQQMVMGMGAPAPAPAAAAAAASAPAASSSASTAAKDKPADGAKPAATPAPATPAGAPSNASSAAPSNGTNSAAPADKASAEKAAAAPAGFAMPAPPMPMVSDLPDYRPAFNLPAARADADANIWIRTSTPGSLVGSAVYDVINNKGELVDRVDVPPNMIIVGFGKKGVVYLTRRDGDGLHLLKANIH